jgi:hypothetical protein
MNYEKIEIAAALFVSAPDSNCECEAMDLYYEIKDMAKGVDYENKKATQAFSENVRKICMKAGLTSRCAVSFGNVAKTAVLEAYIPF